MDKKNKVVIITGASSGIGKALAFAFAEEKYDLVLGSRSIDKLNEIRIQLESNGINVLTVTTDVTIESDCKNLIDRSVERFGGIDILINNAGISMRALFRDVNLEVMKELMAVNFWGTVYCTHYALPHLLERRGSLTGVISIAGYIGLPGRAGYSASKFAVRGFLNTLRIENLKNGLHVLVVAPGFTSSNIRITARTADGSQQGESPRDESGMMSAEEVAKAILSAIRRRKSSLILTFVEGKFTVFASKLFPRLLDRLAYNHMAKEANSPFK